VVLDPADERLQLFRLQGLSGRGRELRVRVEDSTPAAEQVFPRIGSRPCAANRRTGRGTWPERNGLEQLVSGGDPASVISRADTQLGQPLLTRLGVDHLSGYPRSP